MNNKLNGDRLRFKRPCAHIVFLAVLTCSLALRAEGAADANRIASAQAPKQPEAQIGLPFDANVRKEVVEALAQKLQDEYAHAELGEKMALAIRAKLAAGAYDKAASQEAFALALQNDLHAVVNDRHLTVSYKSDAPMMQPMRPGGAMPSGGPAPGPMRMPSQSAVPRVEILEGNIGYLQLNSLPPLPAIKEVFDAAFAILKSTDALIIDARGNGGGTPDSVAYVMSYLSEGEPYVVNRIQHRGDNRVIESRTTDVGERSYGKTKPVFYLTAYRTFSAAEELAYDIQSFKRGKIVGETTGGGANPAFPQALKYGFVASIPNAFAVHPVTGTNWEGVGVKPDVKIPASFALIEAQRLAIEGFKSNAAGSARLAALDGLLQRLAIEALGITSEHPLPNALSKKQILGSYMPLDGRSRSYDVLEKDGKLMLQPGGGSVIPPSRLLPLNADRYQLDGLPADFTATFSLVAGGKVRLLLCLDNATQPVALQKQ